MRIRQIKPSWFLDKELRKGVSADVREFYVGLWMIADDAGWFVWDTERIAAELYPYETPNRRERNVERWATALEELNPGAPHLVVYDCGHAAVPKMPNHQRNAGRMSVNVRDKHRVDCRGSVATSSHTRLRVATEGAEPLVATRSQSPHGKEESGKSNGTERNGTVVPPAGAREGAARSEFQAKVPKLAALGKS